MVHLFSDPRDVRCRVKVKRKVQDMQSSVSADAQKIKRQRTLGKLHCSEMQDIQWFGDSCSKLLPTQLDVE